jgi:hypothetical protein
MSLIARLPRKVMPVRTAPLRAWSLSTSAPRTITLEQMKGFSLFILKAVLSGRGDEIVDLARINLFQ